MKKTIEESERPLSKYSLKKKRLAEGYYDEKPQAKEETTEPKAETNQKEETQEKPKRPVGRPRKAKSQDEANKETTARNPKPKEDCWQANMQRLQALGISFRLKLMRQKEIVERGRMKMANIERHVNETEKNMAKTEETILRIDSAIAEMTGKEA